MINRQLEHLADECGEVSVLDLITNFSAKMFAHIMDKIRSSRVNDVVASAKTESILTVPAAWKLAQREMMVQAAERAGKGAGIPAPKLISEPEAAAIFCMHERLVRQPTLRCTTNHGNQVRGSRGSLQEISER